MSDDIMFGEFDLDLGGLSPQDSESVMDFEKEDTDFGLGDLTILDDNDEPEFEDSHLDLGTLQVEPRDDYIPEPVVEDPTLVVDAFIRHLSANPNLVTALHKGVTAGKLSMIGSAINCDLNGLYTSNKMVNVLVNAVASGNVVSDRFETAIPNTVKMYYVPSNKRDSIHLHKTSAGVHTYKATPAILSFDEETIDGLNAVFKPRLGSFSRLSSYLTESCYKPVAKDSKGDDKAYLAQDNLTIAKNLAKSKMTIDGGINKLSRTGLEKARCDRIAVLAKALRDNA